MPKSWPMCTDMSLLLEPQMRLSDRALGSGPAASDRRVRLHGAWLRQGGPGLGYVPLNFAALGVPARHQMGWLTILVEIFGGLAVLLGALVPLASIPMAAVLLVAMLTVHLPYGFSSIKLQTVTAAGAQFGPPGL